MHGGGNYAALFYKRKGMGRMEFELTLGAYMLVCPLVFLAGLIDSVAGGGGLISIPAYLAAGLPAHLAAGTNKLSAMIGTGAATIRFFRGGRIRMACALAAAALALPGSYLGTLAFNRIDEATVVRMMLAVIPIVAAVVLLRRGSFGGSFELSEKWLLPVCALIGLAIGFYDGLVGPGTGTFLILAFTFLTGMDAVTASGSAKVVNLASNIASAVTQIFAGHVLFALGLPAAVFGLAGNMVGAQLALRGGEKIVRLMLLIVLALLLANMAMKLAAA